MSNATRRRVFLVHGRNNQAREALEALLRAFDLKVVTWRQAATWAGGGSPYTGDIVAAGLAHADAVVVLLTPDDEGRLKPEFWQDRDGPDERRHTGQPRMNVLFEAGMAMALGRDRVVVVEVGAVRRMSDIDGVNVVRLDDSIERRRDLAARLTSAGLDVDMDDESWRTAGSFAPTVTSAPAVATAATERPASAAVGPAPSRSGKPEAYLALWTAFVERALTDERTRGWVRRKKPSRDNWLVLESRRYGQYVVGFSSGDRLRAELYLDSGDAHANKSLFDRLDAERDRIERSFGGDLSWERLPDRRSCRVAAYRAGQVLDTARHDEYVEWFLATISQLRNTLDAELSRGGFG